MWTLPSREVPQSSTHQPKHWLTAVAKEAPLTPMSSTKMKIGSNTMFRMAPEAIPIMPKRALP